jgi:hypothetical protein
MIDNNKDWMSVNILPFSLDRIVRRLEDQKLRTQSSSTSSSSTGSTNQDQEEPDEKPLKEEPSCVNVR